MPFGTNCCSSSYPTGCCGQKYNFNIVYGQDYSGPYDPYSLMQYRADAFAIPGRDTMVPARPGGYVPRTNPNKVSFWDLKRVCKLYAPPY
ncbi:hypothetical protein CPC08DRAFT_715926, partial [Agrocybe pediades]